MQEATAADLIWPISYLLADLCRLITLEPGDIVLSGTPANSRPMEPGDVVEVEVSGLGRLTNTVEEWEVDLSGPGDQLEVSANTLHVALAMPEDEAERSGGRVIAHPPHRPRVPARRRRGRGGRPLERPVRADR